MLLKHIEQDRPNSQVIKSRLERIYADAITQSRCIRKANFTQIENADLQRLFAMYDETFLANACGKTLSGLGCPLSFRLSGKMTRAGGKTTRNERFDRSGRVVSRQFEITVSTTLLFGTFRTEDRPILVAGLQCRDRLEALMRVMEHEIIHLVEMLLWRESSCAAYRFREIAGRLFEHRESNHQLITPQERAFKDLGIRAGDQVSFRFEGRELNGKVNRITRRATVLVPSDRGELYNDGIRYKKFYVPLAHLQRCEPTQRAAGIIGNTR